METSLELSSKHRKYLKGLAHSMSALVHVGKGGVSSELLIELDRILTEHELIKVKISAASKDEFLEIAEDLSAKAKAALVHSIGRVAILYRQTQVKERRRIKLP